MRFLADECVSVKVVERLRASGLDVASAGERSLGAPDKEIVGALRAEARILITEDQAFSELIVRHRLGVSGVLLLELDQVSSTAGADAVAAVVSSCADKIPDSLVVIMPGRMRVRPLPRPRPSEG